MQVRYDEGVATHIGPKPCVGIREGAGEASVGERIGQQLSHEKPVVPDADVFVVTEGDTLERVIASALKVRRGRRTWHVRKSLYGNREVSSSACGWTSQVRIGKARSCSR